MNPDQPKLPPHEGVLTELNIAEVGIKAKKPDPFEHLTNKQLDEWMTLALATLKAQRQKQTPFDILLRDIYNATQQFMCKHGDRPKTVFLGFEQMRAFDHMPSWLIRRDEAMVGKPQMVEGLEVIQVIKASFLRVA